MLSELKYLSDYHVVEFEEFMILKNFRNQTIVLKFGLVKTVELKVVNKNNQRLTLILSTGFPPVDGQAFNL